MNAKENINIHRKQLFHWIGGNLDKKNGRRKILSNELAQKCLCYIQSSLEEGIWVKPPQESEEFSYNKQSFKLNRPIACFTELSLNESLPHTGGYGRLGFGFSRKWVIERGGQSVSYFRHNAKAAPFLATIFKLLNALGKYDNAKGTWAAKGNSKQEKSAFDELVYLIHFAKMIRPRIKSDTRKKKKETKGKQLKELLGEKKEPKPLNQALQDIRDYVQDYGGKMKFVEEREWRIVHREDSRYFHPSAFSELYHLPYTPGENLFTLVVPDKKVLSKLLQCTFLTERLFTPWKIKDYKMGSRKAPPVTILSHSEIGTF